MSNVANFVEQMKKYKDNSVKTDSNVKVCDTPTVIIKVNTQMLALKR